MAGTGYPDGTSSRLVSPFLTLPAAITGQRIQLRFWQWFSYGSYAGGQVQVSVWSNGVWNAWANLDGSATGYGGIWSLGQVDLTRYAGQFVRIAFQHRNTSSYAGTGWFVDDVQIWQGVPNFNNPQGFELGWGDWYADNGIWQIGVPTGGPPTNTVGWRAHGGTNCAGTVLAGTGYPSGTSSRLVSPAFILPAATGPGQLLLNWWEWFSYGSYAYGQIQISVWSNGVWSAWATIGNSSGSSSVWAPRQVDLYAYGGLTVRIAFDHTDTSSYAGVGWFVDDVQVYPYVIPIGTESPLSRIPDTNVLESVVWQYTPTVGGSGYAFGLSNAPSGMSVGTSTGTIQWTPDESQGPSTNNNITYIVYSAGSRVASTNFNVIVNEVNVAPVLYVPGQQSVYATTTLTVTNYATDSDWPANSLTFALAAGTPSGVVINPTTGVLTWTPTTGQVGTSTIWVKVTDYNPWAVNTQQLSVTNSFSVIVKGLTPPSFLQTPTNLVVGPGQSFTFTSLATGFPSPAYQWQFSANGVSYGNISGATGNSYTLGMSSLPNIGYYRVVASNSQGTITSTGVSLTFLKLNMYAGLSIMGPLGANYSVQAIPAVGGTNWSILTNVSLPTQPYIYIDYSSPTNAKQFYRAVPQ